MLESLCLRAFVAKPFCSYYAKNICNSQQKVINYQKIYKNPFTYLLLLALSVAALSYFDSYGGITMDAPWYLRLAQSIKEGNGFAVMSPDYVYYNEAQNFFIWPPLYPMLTGYFALVTNLPVYIAIKIVNLIFIGITIFLLHKYYRQQAPIYILLFFHASFFDMVYQGWSEVPFICVLIWFLLAMDKFLNSDKHLKWASAMSLASMMAVGLRYLGIITLLPFCFLIYQTYKQKNTHKIYSIVVISIICLFAELAFIWFNYFVKNKVSGYDWNPSLSELKDFGISFFLQILNSLDFLFCSGLNSWYEKLFSLTIIIMIGYRIIKSKLYTKSEKSADKTIMICAVTLGIAYLIIPLLMLNSYAIGINNSRFFMVSTILILFGILHFYQIKISYKFLFHTSLIIFAINCIGKSIYMNQYLKSDTFVQRYERLESKYKSIEPKSGVAFADKWLEFMRTDVYVMSPYENVMKNLSPTLSEFEKCIMKHPGPVYFEIIKNGDKRMFRYNSSITDFHKQNQGKEFVKLK